MGEVAIAVRQPLTDTNYTRLTTETIDYCPVPANQLPDPEVLISNLTTSLDGQNLMVFFDGQCQVSAQRLPGYGCCFRLGSCCNIPQRCPRDLLLGFLDGFVWGDTAACISCL